MAIENAKQAVADKVERLQYKIDFMRDAITAFDVLRHDIKEPCMTKEKAIQVITSRQFVETVPPEVIDKLGYLMESKDLAETWIETLRSALDEVYCNGVECALLDLEADLNKVIKRLDEIYEIITEDPDSKEANVLRVERYGLERRVLHLTLAQMAFA